MGDKGFTVCWRTALLDVKRGFCKEINVKLYA